MNTVRPRSLRPPPGWLRYAVLGVLPGGGMSFFSSITRIVITRTALKAISTTSQMTTSMLKTKVDVRNG